LEKKREIPVFRVAFRAELSIKQVKAKRFRGCSATGARRPAPPVRRNLVSINLLEHREDAMFAPFQAPYAPSTARRISPTVARRGPREARQGTTSHSERRPVKPRGRTPAAGADRPAFCRAYAELRLAKWEGQNDPVPLSALRAAGQSDLSV